MRYLQVNYLAIPPSSPTLRLQQPLITNKLQTILPTSLSPISPMLSLPFLNVLLITPLLFLSNTLSQPINYSFDLNDKCEGNCPPGWNSTLSAHLKHSDRWNFVCRTNEDVGGIWPDNNLYQVGIGVGALGCLNV